MLIYDMFTIYKIHGAFEFVHHFSKNEMKDWINTLRTGNYRQCSGSLRKQAINRYKYCCLGVLCNINDKYKWDMNKRTAICLTNDDASDNEVPGVDTFGQELFSELNDDCGFSFKQIADVIELALKSKTAASFETKLETYFKKMQEKK